MKLFSIVVLHESLFQKKEKKDVNYGLTITEKRRQDLINFQDSVVDQAWREHRVFGLD